MCDIGQYITNFKIWFAATITTDIIVVIICLIIWRLFKKFRPDVSKYILILVGAVVVYMLAFSIVPACYDICTDNIHIAENVEYKRRYHNPVGKPFISEYHRALVNITDSEGESFEGRLIDDNETLYPYGEGKGTVVYGGFSKYIIEFIFDEELS